MTKTRDGQELIGEERAAIKKLLILALLRAGATQEEIAAALGVSQSTVSRMFPGGIGNVTKVEPSK